MNSNGYNNILGLIDHWVAAGTNDFQTMSRDIEGELGALSHKDLSDVIEQIGIIPEKYDHDSTHEKLYAKMSDCVVSFIFKQLGFESKVLTERGDSADVIAKSRYHNYEFVADAKVFRLSRTAKNQKDFKINSMNQWRGDSDYAMIVCPIYQYPNTSSAIFAQVLDTEVAISSYEHLRFCIENGACESSTKSLKSLFTYPKTVSASVIHSERKRAAPVFDALNLAVAQSVGKTVDDFLVFRNQCLLTVSSRAKVEKTFWEDIVSQIEKMTLEEAREALIESRKIKGKIDSISEYIID
jgi:type II restriction enzyme